MMRALSSIAFFSWCAACASAEPPRATEPVGEDPRPAETATEPGAEAPPAAPAASSRLVSVEGVAAFDALDEAARERLKKVNLLFVHHPVGRDLIQGATSLGFSFHQFKVSEEHSTVGFLNVAISDSEDAQHKMKMFRAMALGLKLGTGADVMVYEPGTSGFGDPAQVSVLRELYAEHVEAVRVAYPELRIVHVTPSLTAGGSPENRARQEVSQWMKQTYGERDIVFDLAGVESTSPDGKACENDQVRVLCNEYGGADGRLGAEPAKRVAKAFMFAVSRALGAKEASPTPPEPPASLAPAPAPPTPQ